MFHHLFLASYLIYGQGAEATRARLGGSSTTGPFLSRSSTRITHAHRYELTSLVGFIPILFTFVEPAGFSHGDHHREASGNRRHHCCYQSFQLLEVNFFAITYSLERLSVQTRPPLRPQTSFPSPQPPRLQDKGGRSFLALVGLCYS
jgi:hypothetical protein